MGKRTPSETPHKSVPSAGNESQRRPSPSRLLAGEDLANAVFSGGYFIILTEFELLPLNDVETRVQQKRNRKNEEALQLAALARQLSENQDTSPVPQKETTEEAAKVAHERLMQELQALVDRSALVQNPHEQHLKHELEIARRELLRDGSLDDTIIMQTLQEIAELQGLSGAGNSAAGIFVSETIDPPEPENVRYSTPPLWPDALPEGEVPDFYQGRQEHFSAYDVAGIGGWLHSPSYFFASKLKENLLELDNVPQQEATSNEIVL